MLTTRNPAWHGSVTPADRKPQSSNLLPIVQQVPLLRTLCDCAPRKPTNLTPAVFTFGAALLYANNRTWRRRSTLFISENRIRAVFTGCWKASNDVKRNGF